jgi:glycosyltransferase involved in cell wall biosynthesis
MRVALWSYSARAGDAIGNSVAEKAAFFQQRGAEVRVFLEVDVGIHPDLRPISQVVAPARPEGEWWRFARSADLMLVEFGQHYGLLDLLPLLAGRGPRILMDYHGITPPHWWGPHNREALVRGIEQRGLVWCADAVLVHSRFMERELLEECGLPAERLHRLGFPIDLERWSAAAKDLSLRRRLGLEEASILLFVGRLAPNKRVPLLVEALGRLRQRTPPVHALIVGDTSDLYQAQADACREKAAVLGVADRLHFLGPCTGAALRAAYQAADVLVVPSLWESFSIPVLEAMASGVPVLAARAGALPETVGDAGLTFTPDNVDDLVRQLERLLPGERPALAGWYWSRASRPTPAARRIAIVSPRYGDDLGSGVERSLRVIAETLQAGGHTVEVFTTCAHSEGCWKNELPAGRCEIGGIPVERFPLDKADHDAYQAALTDLLQAKGPAPAEVEARLLALLSASTALLQVLSKRRDEFDGIIVGPYLSGLTLAVARSLPEKTIVVPCFHDEPLAHLATWGKVYGEAAGLFYHSREEQEFAQAGLGLNHPYAAVIGTFLEMEKPPFLSPTPTLSPQRGRRETPSIQGRYLVYCGRYLREKGVGTLIEFARRYSVQHPGRFTFAFAGGAGEVAIPAEPWACDLGFVPERHKRRLLAAADALVQLSLNESLSLVALESWAAGTPVLADRRCAVLAGHIARSGGGAAVTGYEEFARALDDLWDQPEQWRRRGEQGRQYVRAEYGCRAEFLARLETALMDLGRPLAEQMRHRGLERAKQFDAVTWRDQLGRIAEQLLESPARPCRQMVEVRPRSTRRTVRLGTATVLAAVRVVNWGTHPITAEGPGRTVLRCRVVDANGQDAALPVEDTLLPGLLLPGQGRAAAVAVPVPAEPGRYRVDLWAAGPENDEPTHINSFRLVVSRDEIGEPSCCGPLLEVAASDLAEAERLQRLPDDYVDVTEGLLASLKRRIKRKLLGNFKHAYVDVLSRQQSAFNRQILAALAELTECCATLDHALSRLAAGPRRAREPIHRFARSPRARG